MKPSKYATEGRTRPTSAPRPDPIDMSPSESRNVAAFIDALIGRFGGLTQVGAQVGLSHAALSRLRDKGECVKPATSLGVLATFAKCTIQDILAGRATVPSEMT